MKYEETAKKVIGYAMQIHRTLGNGFQEVIYQRALEVEFVLGGLSFTREKEMEIYYKNKVIGTRRVDFFVEGNVMIELKALIKLEDVHTAQAKNYCEAYNMEVGLLINFGAKSLDSNEHSTITPQNPPILKSCESWFKTTYNPEL